MNKLTSKVLITTAGLLLLGGSFYFGTTVIERQEDVVKLESEVVREFVNDLDYQGRVFPSDIRGLDYFEETYKMAGDVDRVDASSAIVAHHLLVSDQIARVFKSIGSDDVETVIIMGPNHFSSGVSPAQTTVGAWETPYGLVYTDDELVNKLVGDVEIVKDEFATFEIEHSIGAVTPFIAKSFPNAKIVPIVIHESLIPEEADRIGEYIAEHYKDTVVISSIDMSHNVPIAVQEYHDAVTRRTLAAGNLDLTLEIDANMVLRTMFEVNEQRGAQNWVEMYHGSSRLMNATKDWEENTSHTMGYFEKGEPVISSFASLHVVGDIMLDRDVRRLIDLNGVDYPWEKVGRYLMGSHRTIGNLEGTVSDRAGLYTVDPPFRFTFTPESVERMHELIDVVSLANNHSSDFASAGLAETKARLDELEIPWFGSYRSPVPRLDEDVNGIKLTYIGYHQFQPNLAELEDEIARADADGRFVIVFPHWGTEYIATPQANQRVLAERMVEAGADLIVGGHPHVAQGIEIVDGVPVVYSLGNFVFDQRLEQTYLTYTLGIIIEEDRVIMHLIPIDTRNSQPTPVGADIALRLFGSLADISSTELQPFIQDGVITIPYGQGTN